MPECVKCGKITYQSPPETCFSCRNKSLSLEEFYKSLDDAYEYLTKTKGKIKNDN